MIFDCIAAGEDLPKRVEVISLLFLFGGTIFAAGVIDAEFERHPLARMGLGNPAGLSVFRDPTGK